MKKFIPFSFIIVFAIAIFTSCSRNDFQVRKNYHSRIKVEVNNIYIEKGVVSNDLSIRKIPVENKLIIAQQGHVKIKKEKETLMEKMANVFIPKKKELLKPIFHPKKETLNTSKSTDDRTTGLIINLLALAFGIAAVLMVIGMVHGNVWVYFVIGLVLAAAAIIMGFIGKMMAWKGFGWLAGVIGILAVILLLIFLLLITVVHTTF